MQLYVRITPRSKKFRITLVKLPDGSEEVRINITEEPEKGKGNAELVKQLSRITCGNVMIIRGATSRKKLLEIDGDEQQILEAIRKAACH
ncbi:TPA: DUF167 domain-containing protein [Candidatus Micrarchaeota archaeon]|nr:DUF167 domain-containing protein [Candidatus Micrarchaeota archaeon]